MIITYAIIGLTVAFSLFGMNNEQFFSKLKFNAYDARHSNQIYRFFTYGLIHAGYLHLIINMLVLYSFGRVVESYFGIYFPGKGGFYYLLLYVGGLILSVIPAYGKHKNDIFYNAVGASGAIAAVLFTSIILHPAGRIMIFPIPVGIPAPLFGILYIAYEYYMSRNSRDNIGHDAHLWGAIFGIIFTAILNPKFIGMFFEEVGIYF